MEHIWQYFRIFLSKHLSSLDCAVRYFKQKLFSSEEMFLISLSSIHVGHLLPDLLTNGCCSSLSSPLLLDLNWKMDISICLDLVHPPALHQVQTEKHSMLVSSVSLVRYLRLAGSCRDCLVNTVMPDTATARSTGKNTTPSKIRHFLPH